MNVKDQVKVRRTSGVVEDDWRIASIEDAPYKAPEVTAVIVIKPITEGEDPFEKGTEILWKAVSLWDLLKLKREGG